LDKLLTVPSDEVRAALDQRRYPEQVRDTESRSGAQRDRDRVLYSSAFLRLAHVTQVAAPDVGHIFHSRLTHSLKVAQFARRLAERFKADAERPKLHSAAARLVESLDVDATEAAALAHDLGHPPFGHLAEEVLKARCESFGSFEGNAQSFRIVTRLAIRAVASPGLNLTRRTLNGMLKYPWLRDSEHAGRWDKWGAYRADHDYFAWAREGLPDGQRTLEAEIMDWADDVTYAVHDMDDFYRAGLIPLERLRPDDDELRGFERYLRARIPDHADRLVDTASRLLAQFIPVKERYRGRMDQRADLRKLGSWLIARYANAVSLRPGSDADSAYFAVPAHLRDEVTVLKQLTWYYIIERPSLSTIQYGQRQVIGGLFDTYSKAAEDGDARVFPPAVAERLLVAPTPAASKRVVVDLISGMTEASAFEMYRRMQGVSDGSVLATVTGPG
jgi:dGTPase